MRTTRSRRAARRGVLLASLLASLAVAPAASAQSPLEGEVLFTATNADVTVDNCAATTTNINFTATGTAVGPTPGTFTETGTVALGALQDPAGETRGVTSAKAGFEIQGADGTVITGVKSLDASSSAAFQGYGICEEFVRLGVAPMTYSARIVSPDGTVTCDRGTAYLEAAQVLPGAEQGPPFEAFYESFTSTNYGSCGPQTSADCMKDGWAAFPGFKNQGDCVSFIRTGGKNEAGQNTPGK